jgi:RND family efflux transporter MFP subunit
MNYWGGVLTGVGVALLAAAGWWVAVGKPGGGKPTPPPVPAAVPKPFKEDQLGVTLSPEAEAKVGIALGTVTEKAVPRKRTYGGEVVVPPGKAVVVSAPLAGTLKAVSGPFPAAGTTVKRGQTVFHLLPLLDPVGRANLAATQVQAEGERDAAAENKHAAQIAVDLAKKVLAGGAGRQRDVDEAQALLDVASKQLAAATARAELLKKVLGDLESGTAAPIPVEAPDDGVVRSVSALPGQTVPTGAILFEVVNLDAVWVRVPVYVGDLPEVDTGKPVAVGALNTRAGGPSRPAALVSAPPAANPATGTTDLFYGMPNQDHYNPGQRVSVSVPLRTPAASLTVPWSAVVFDVHGGAWVYEKTADRTYARRRVEVRYVADTTAVLEAGPKPGTTVVVIGAEELFGTETGYSK